MAEDVIDVTEVEGLNNDVQNTAAIAQEVNTDVNEAAYNERLGATGDQKLITINKDGTVEVNGEECKTPEEMRDALNKLPADQLAKVKAALGNADLGNGDPTIRENAIKQGKANNQTQLMQDVFDDPSSGTTDEAKFETIVKKLQDSNPSFWSKLLKYTCIGGASYLLLQGMANAKTGCYAVLGNNQNLMYKTKSKDDCYLFSGSAPNIASVSGNLDCQSSCTQLTQNGTAATLAQLNAMKQQPSNSSCNCVDSNGNLVSPNVSINFQNPGPFDILGEAINGIGGFVAKLANGALGILNAAADLVSMLPKILMWVGIAAAIVGVIVGFVYLGKKLHDKKKAKAGLAGGGGKKRFKHWRRAMKQVQRSTPYNHLTMSHAMFQ